MCAIMLTLLVGLTVATLHFGGVSMGTFIFLSVIWLVGLATLLDYMMPDDQEEYRPYPREIDEDQTIQGAEGQVGEWEHPK